MALTNGIGPGPCAAVSERCTSSVPISVKTAIVRTLVTAVRISGRAGMHRAASGREVYVGVCAGGETGGVLRAGVLRVISSNS